MSRLRFILWVLLAWPLPAVLAHALGWRGVWGSGSALMDYLIPLPVAGGVLHVPSFVVCSLIVLNMPSASAQTAGRMRAFLVGVAVAGVLCLLRLDELLLALRTQSTMPSHLWQDNPLGLFLLCDALVALLLTVGASQGGGMRLGGLNLLLIVLPASLPLAMAMKYSPAGQSFLPGASRQGPTRFDEINMVFTRMDTDTADFRQQAELWVQPMHPRLSINSDDAAFLFTRNLDAARNFDVGQVARTLCLYEDGTPPVWLPGAAAAQCFDGHVSFSEAIQRAYDARPSAEPPDLKSYMARKDLCVGVKTIPPSGETGGVELSGMRLCGGMPEAREKLKLKYPDAAALRD